MLRRRSVPLVLAGALSLAALLGSARAEQARPIIVAAESVYGQIAEAIAGPDADVFSILRNPDQDPHLFEASPSTAREVGRAGIAIRNGAGYDPWMDRLLAATAGADRQEISVAALLGVGPDANPHLWYRPDAAPRLADALTAALAARDPAHAAGYAARRRALQIEFDRVGARVAALRATAAGAPATATEPVFGWMADALGLRMRNARFQLAVMNGGEPRASDVAAFEGDLRHRRVRLLFTNAQVDSAAATRLVAIARGAGVPVVAVTETLPAGATYAGWVLGELDAVAAALGAPARPAP